jgi:hypothetical protein
VNITGNGMNYPCGFYPGPGVEGDRIEFLCKDGAIGDTVTITLQSKDERNIINLCEVEVYGHP